MSKVEDPADKGNSVDDPKPPLDGQSNQGEGANQEPTEILPEETDWGKKMKAKDLQWSRDMDQMKRERDQVLQELELSRQERIAKTEKGQVSEVDAFIAKITKQEVLYPEDLKELVEVVQRGVSHEIAPVTSFLAHQNALGSLAEEFGMKEVGEIGQDVVAKARELTAKNLTPQQLLLRTAYLETRGAKERSAAESGKKLSAAEQKKKEELAAIAGVSEGGAPAGSAEPSKEEQLREYLFPDGEPLLQ